MTNPGDPAGPSPEGDEKVSCASCRRLVPRSEAFQPEAEDYLIYFCGLDCYDRWSRDEPEPPGPPSHSD